MAARLCHAALSLVNLVVSQGGIMGNVAANYLVFFPKNLLNGKW